MEGRGKVIARRVNAIVTDRHRCDAAGGAARPSGIRNGNSQREVGKRSSDPGASVDRNLHFDRWRRLFRRLGEIYLYTSAGEEARANGNAI